MSHVRKEFLGRQAYCPANKRAMISRLERRVLNCKLCVVATIAWLIGLAFIWWRTPTGPRPAWRPPTGDYVCGILADGCTVVTATGVPDGQSAQPGRHISLWDIATGKLLETRLQQPFERSALQVPGDLLALEGPIESHGDGRIYRTLRLSNAKTGREVGAFSRPDDQLGGRYALAPDCRTVAIVAYENGEPWVECYDVNSGWQLTRLVGCSGPICYCSDGSRVALI
jgi:hypothetical protein